MTYFYRTLLLIVLMGGVTLQAQDDKLQGNLNPSLPIFEIRDIDDLLNHIGTIQVARMNNTKPPEPGTPSLPCVLLIDPNVYSGGNRINTELAFDLIYVEYLSGNSFYTPASSPLQTIMTQNGEIGLLSQPFILTLGAEMPGTFLPASLDWFPASPEDAILDINLTKAKIGTHPYDPSKPNSLSQYYGLSSNQLSQSLSIVSNSVLGHTSIAIGLFTNSYQVSYNNAHFRVWETTVYTELMIEVAQSWTNTAYHNLWQINSVLTANPSNSLLPSFFNPYYIPITSVPFVVNCDEVIEPLDHSDGHLRLHDEGGSRIQVIPNPISDVASMSGYALQAGEISYQIFSSTGAQVMADSWEVHAAGDFIKKVDLGALTPGVYSIYVHTPGHNPYLKRVVKL